jgi:hypothetical protein
MEDIKLDFENVPVTTYFIEGQGLSEYPNCGVDIHKRKRSGHYDSDARNRVPVDQSLFRTNVNSSAASYPPYTNKIDGYRATECRLEPPGKGFIT